MKLVKVGGHLIDPEEVAAIRQEKGRAATQNHLDSGQVLEMFPADVDGVYEALQRRGRRTQE